MVSKKSVQYGRFLFGKIQPYDLLEFTNSFAYEKGNIVKPPFNMALPLEICYCLTFTEDKGKTTINMTGEPVNASVEEYQTFNSANDSMSCMG